MISVLTYMRLWVFSLRYKDFLFAAKGQADLGITSVVLVSSTNVLILNQNSINQKTLPNFTADLVFICLDSAALLLLNEQQFYFFGQIQNSQTGGHPYSDTFPYGECSLD